MRAFLGAALFLLAGAASALSAERAIIILDASGSMWGQIDGRAKQEIAREALRTVLKTVPAATELGFMAYGHREKGSCADIELVVPPAMGTGDAITAAADRLQFLGKTPLSAAVKQAAQDLRYTEDKATVILITDGIETCEADPCAAASELEKAGVDFTAHVVGFGLTEEEGRQVACLAENTGGRYLQASDAGQLEDALVQTVVEAAPASEPAPPASSEPVAPEYNFAPTTVLAEGGPALVDAGNSYEVYRVNPDGSRGEQVTTEYSNWKGTLDPGQYVVKAAMGEASVEMPVTIEPGKLAEPVFILNAGTLKIRPLPNEGGEVVDGATVVIDYPGEGEATEYGEVTIVVPAGEQKLTVTIGAGQVTDTVQVAAGQTVERNVVVGIGHAAVNAYYVPGMKVEDAGLSVEVLKAAKKIDGSRERVGYAYGPDSGHDLPPGDYVAVAQMGAATAEAPFAVTIGTQVDVEVVLNAGVLAITAPGAGEIEVFAAKKDIQGNRKSFGNAYGAEYQTTLPAGEYAVVARPEGDAAPKEVPATVTAGERTELTVP